MPWSFALFPFLGGTAAPAGQQSGTITSVPADGTPRAVLFAQPYLVACSGVTATVATATPGTYELSLQVSAIGVAGFTVTVTGGAPGSTVTVNYLALGS